MSSCTGVIRGIHCGCVTCRVVRVAFTVDECHVKLYGWHSLWTCDMSSCTGGIHCGRVTCRVVRVAFTVDV